ncbi:MAG: energy transducer TonB [Chitinophagaceae bacterium]|nr:energy transducer TonB [Chitinophagaceae bacterium]
MKKIIALSALYLSANGVLAQNEQDNEIVSAKPSIKKEEKTIKVVEQMPEFIGGEKGLYKFIAENVRYPDSATKYGIEGQVKVKFIVDEKGHIISATTTNTSFGYGLEEEAVRVVKMLPRWKPGKNNGKPVKVYYQIPIRFVLPKEEDTIKTK